MVSVLLRLQFLVITIVLIAIGKTRIQYRWLLGVVVIFVVRMVLIFKVAHCLVLVVLFAFKMIKLIGPVHSDPAICEGWCG